MTYELSASVRDFMTDPQMKKALRAREDRYLANIAWLDQDLTEKLHLTNIAWLDQDLAEKVFGLKLWHCGHGVGGSAAAHESMTPEEKRARVVRIDRQYEDGLTNNTCLIGHRHQQENEVGGNTRKQFMKFQSEAKEGDIIFNHCSRRGGLTHYGFFTGEISRVASPAPEDAGQGWFHSFISVKEWIPLEAVMMGTGNRPTLYEVTRTTKEGKPTNNYQNYEQVVRDIVSSS